MSKLKSGTMEIELKKFNRVVAHTRCNCYEDYMQIVDLFVVEKYKGKGMEQYLMTKVIEHAKSSKVRCIRAYLGAEPFNDCKTDIENEKRFYEDNGFKFSHLVLNTTPCMVKVL